MNDSRHLARKLALAITLVVLIPGVAWLAWSRVWVPSYLRAGRAALGAKDYSRAQRYLQKYLDWQPNAVDVNLQLAEALAEQGRMQKALEHLSCVPDAAPQAASARWHEASLLLQMNFAARAEQAARRCLELDPQSLDARQLLAVICRWEGRNEEAEKVFWELYDLCPPAQRVVALLQLFELHYGEYSVSETARRLEQFLKADSSDFAARLALARMHVGAGQYQRATELLEACWRQNPGDFDTRAALVNCHLASGAYDRAARLLETWPDAIRDRRYWEYLGTLQNDHQQDFAAAAESFRRVVAETPDDWRSRHRLGICLQALDDPQGAQAELQAAERLREVLQRERMEQMLKALPELVKTAEGRFQLGQLYERVGRTREAQCWYQEVVALDPEHPDGRQGLMRLASSGPHPELLP